MMIKYIASTLSVWCPNFYTHLNYTSLYLVPLIQLLSIDIAILVQFFSPKTTYISRYNKEIKQTRMTLLTIWPGNKFHPAEIIDAY